MGAADTGKETPNLLLSERPSSVPLLKGYILGTTEVKSRKHLLRESLRYKRGPRKWVGFPPAPFLAEFIEQSQEVRHVQGGAEL